MQRRLHYSDTSFSLSLHSQSITFPKIKRCQRKTHNCGWLWAFKSPRWLIMLTALEQRSTTTTGGTAAASYSMVFGLDRSGPANRFWTILYSLYPLFIYRKGKWLALTEPVKVSCRIQWFQKTVSSPFTFTFSPWTRRIHGLFQATVNQWVSKRRIGKRFRQGAVQVQQGKQRILMTNDYFPDLKRKEKKMP